MLVPPPRRKPATELEVKLARGDPAARDALIDLLDDVLHRDLGSMYPWRLPDDERAKIVVDVIADFVNGTIRYDHDQASIETLAKRRARQRAIDWIRHQKVQEKAAPRVAARAALLLVVDDPADATERSELVERLIVEIEQLPQNQRRAALAYMRHGEADPEYGGKAYSTILAEELGVDAGLVSQWWYRAQKRLRKALNIEPSTGKHRSEA
ncbi:MAG: RNA polymerase sigma factor [Phycisphaerales bacterium]